MKICNFKDVSKELKYHLDNEISIANNVFRIGTPSWAALICEARDHYENGDVEVDEDEQALFASDSGKLALFDGRTEVMLDTPFVDWTVTAKDEEPSKYFCYTLSDGVVNEVFFEKPQE